MSFKDVPPDIHLKAIYNYTSRKIILDIGGVNIKSSDDSELPGLLFQANIHRDITETIQEQRIRKISSIISAWKDDISDFTQLVTKFNPEKAS